MSSKTAPDSWNGGWVPFACSWRREGPAAASVQASGELDIATSPQLGVLLHEALGHARLVLLDVREVSFMDCSAVHAIVDASAAARQVGRRLLLVGISQQAATLFEMTGTASEVEMVRLETTGASTGEDRLEPPGGPYDRGGSEDQPSEVEARIHPLDNPVNARVMTGRVMAIPDVGLWVHAVDGAVHRAWAPRTPSPAVAAGTAVEVYFDRRGEINGWWDPRSGLAVNQRHLAAGVSPACGAAAACQGACGLVWQVPAPDRFAGHGERCLTCAGPLALR